MAQYKQDEELKHLGEEVIRKTPKFAKLADKDCRIAYQKSNEQKKSRNMLVYADTEKVKDKLKGFVPYDFIITFYEPNIISLSPEQLEKLMYHELEHVGYKGPGSYYIVPHDVEDFRDVIDMWGIDWI